MKFRVGACALLVCLAGCTAETPGTKFGDQRGAASAGARTAQRLPSVQTGRQASQSVANAPDRGELISYKNKGAAIKREGAYTWYPVAISEAHALKAVVDGVMSIPSPDGSQVKVRYERHVEHPDGNWTWIGRVIGGDQKQEAILTFGEKAVFGSIPQKTGAPLNLQTRNGMLYAVATDLSKVKNPNSRTDMMVPPAAALRSQLLASASKAPVSQSAGETKAATAATTIDIAIGYSSGLTAVYGSQSATVTRLVNLVDVGNQAFNNSLITGALRIVNAVEVNYADNTTNKAALGELTGHNGTATVPVPASLAPIRTARDQYGADLAVLVRKFQTPENDGCGIAWLNGSDQTPINPTADDDFGFAVISDGNDTGTDGNSYFCAAETLVHELGHLMGSAHDRDNSKKTDGSLLYGRYPYSFGMKTTEANGNFYTIMAYGDNNQNFYRTFSNPLVLKCGPAGNLACGVADQTDNARSLNQTIPVVATFRDTVVPVATAARNDVNGDGSSDLLWHYAPTGEVYQYRMNGTAIASTQGGFNMPAGYTARGVGDFNGDGRADVIWSNGQDLRMTLMTSAGTFAAPVVVVANYPAGWTIAGTQDVNADGKADILWHYAPTGEVYQYRMDGATIISTQGGFNMTAGYTARGVGDFNGDGRADVIWSNAQNQDLRMTLMTSAGTFAAPVVVLPNYPAGWTIAGVQDTNADGKADILWHYAPTGEVYQYRMDGAAIISTQGGFNMTAGYTARAVGDFNGDGRADVVWSNAQNQDLRMTLMTSAGTFAAPVVVLPNYPAGWTIIDNSLQSAAATPTNRAPLDVSGDGKSDLLWHYAPTGEVYQYRMNGTAIASTQGGFNMPAGYTARGVGDFNGDGRADVIWSNGQDLRMTLMTSAGTFAAPVVVVANYPAGWTIAGTQDVNADGKADILWHYAPTGEVYQYRMDGATIISTQGGFNMTAGYTARGVGDFNGDGRADVIWSNAQNQDLRMTLMTSAGTFAAPVVVLPNYPAGWTIAGVQDTNADGKADILWHYAPTGEVYQYRMDGAAIISTQGGFNMTAGYTARAVGDFNGDGRADVVWSNAQNQDLRMTLMTSAGTFAAPVVVLPNYPAGWTIASIH